jgi:hypothetical protein
MSDDLTWFTTRINGHAQEIQIQPWESRKPDETRFFDARETQIFNAVLNELAMAWPLDEYSQARQAILRAFHKLGARPAA